MTHFIRKTAGPAASVLALLLLLSHFAVAQTFRGSIDGTITEQSGAVVAGAQVAAVEVATDVSYQAISSSAGEFTFADLPLGSYSITVTAKGFETVKVDRIPVTAGTTYALPVRLSVASAGETIEVSAEALAADTVTDDQATVLPEATVESLPNNGRDFTQLAGQATGFGGLTTGGGGYLFTINGTRSNDVNYEIEGTDNNDLWWNIPAVNQTGVNGIAGVLLPVDAIENYSFVTSGSTSLGRNPGGTANLTIRSGSNHLHGSAYYFNHNELFQAQNPFADLTPETRNQHIGFSLGGAVKKDRSFFFLSGEKQWFLLGAAAQSGVEPSAAYQGLAENLLANSGGQFGSYSAVAANPVAHNLLYGTGGVSGLWPANALNGPADASGNYHSSGNVIGYSYNSIVKLDEHLTSNDHVSINWFAGEGTQTAPTGSALPWYFENAPIHVQNYSVVYNRVLSPFLANQLALGVSYFHQTFADADTSFDPSALGLDTGSNVAGAPYIKIGPSSSSGGLFAGSGSGFDPIGVTNPSGRTDATGTLDDDLNWTIGSHQLHFGGEYRREQVFDSYYTNARGTLYFDGSQGPWASLAPDQLPNQDGNVAFLADFLAGLPDPTDSNILRGNPTRTVFINTFALYAQDAWKLRPRLSVNYGLRYDFEGVPYTGKQDLSIFDPLLPSGLAVVGQDVGKLYNNYWAGFSPRLGFAYQLDNQSRAALRGGYGLYEDSVYLKEVLQNSWLTNGGVFGPQFNPAGSNEVALASSYGGALTSGSPVFNSLADALAGQGTVAISTFDSNFRPSYTQTYDLNLQYSIAQNVLAQVGYVGTKGTHLTGIFDINQAATSIEQAIEGETLQESRPYYGKFPNFGVINELRSNLGSNYNSLQATLKVASYHGLNAQAGYTWGHALDYETGLLPYLPQNSNDERAEYGNSDYDTRNAFSGNLSYAVPFLRGPARLAKGWEIDSGFAFHSGVPFTVNSSTGNTSGTGEGNDRAQQVIANPFAGVSHSIVNSSSGKYVQWFNPSAFVDPAAGTYATTRRNQNSNPGYEDLDLAIVKKTEITERVSAQLRADIFNVINHDNLSPVAILSNTGEGGTINQTIGVALGNPGIGPGEPLNAQFSLKILF